MKKMLKKLFYTLYSPLITLMVLIDESKSINEDGSWDAYHAKRNKKERGNGKA